MTDNNDGELSTVDRTKPESTVGDLDEILDSIGPFGRYQKAIIFCVLLPTLLPSGIHSYNQLFIAAVPDDYWCHIPPLTFPNSSFSSASLRPRDADGNPSKCLQHNFTHHLAQFDELPFFDNSSRVPCQNGWEYDQTYYQSTVVTDWNLVCDKDYYPSIALLLLALGEFVCSPVLGYASDHYGRKPAFFICLVLQLIFGTATAFSPNFTVFCLFRFFVGGTYGPMYMIVFILGLETVGTKYRATYAVLAASAYAVGCILAGAVSYFVRSWFAYSLWTTLPFVPFLLLWFWMPESPRWLLARGKEKELTQTLGKMAKTNQPKLSAESLKEIDGNIRTIIAGNNSKQRENGSFTFLDLFRTPNVRRNVLVLTFINTINLTVYTGLSYYGPTLISGSPQISFMLITAVEMPANFIVSLTADRFGRKTPFTVGLLLTGVSCLSVIAVDQMDYWPYLVLTMGAKLFCTMAYSFAELVESEVFPTVIRNEATAFTELVASLVSSLVPMIIYLGYQFTALPLIIFGGLALVAGISALWIPETWNKELPATIVDGEDLGGAFPVRDVYKLKRKIIEATGAVRLRSVKSSVFDARM